MTTNNLMKNQADTQNHLMYATAQYLNRELWSASHKAQEFLRAHLHKHAVYEEKPLNYEAQLVNPVTEFDKATEKIIVKSLEESFAQHPILRKHVDIVGEEHAYEKASHPIATVYIDPIDGTKSFIRGEFLCTTSIGAIIGDKKLGVVVDFTRNIFYGTTIDLDGHVEAYVSYGTIERKLPCIPHAILRRTKIVCNDNKKLKKIVGVEGDEAYGSIALTLAQLAYGTIDGCVQKPHITSYYDIAGGLALLEAVGIRATDYDNQKITPENTHNGFIAFKPWIQRKDN